MGNICIKFQIEFDEDETQPGTFLGAYPTESRSSNRATRSRNTRRIPRHTETIGK